MPADISQDRGVGQITATKACTLPYKRKIQPSVQFGVGALPTNVSRFYHFQSGQKKLAFIDLHIQFQKNNLLPKKKHLANSDD
jgi:hypothetical protein